MLVTAEQEASQGKDAKSWLVGQTDIQRDWNGEWGETFELVLVPLNLYLSKIVVISNWIKSFAYSRLTVLQVHIESREREKKE